MDQGDLSDRSTVEGYAPGRGVKKGFGERKGRGKSVEMAGKALPSSYPDASHLASDEGDSDGIGGK